MTIRKLLRFRKKANGAELTFRYTPLGKREVKKSQGRNGGNQYNVHDPNGNIVAIYALTANRLAVVEQSIYGSGRLGIFQKTILRREEETFASPQPSENYTRRLGHRQYKLTDHLGNVHATLLDRKLEKGVTNGEMGYSPEMYFYTDYYPFGFPMPKRFGRTLYRYGFNGQEKDNEIYGEGQSYTAEFWQYDARLGRRWNVDPVRYPSLSSYGTFANNPVRYSDVLGLDTIFMLADGKELRRIKNEKDEEPVGIVLLPELIFQSKRNDNPNNNPYREGSRPWETFNRNINNPNLWNNRSTFSWAGSGQSQWIRDFNRAFGTTLLAGMTGPFAGELAGVALVGSVNAATAIPSVVRTGAFYTRYYGIKALYNTGRIYSTISSRAIQVGIEAYAGNVIGIPIVKIAPWTIILSGNYLGYWSQENNIFGPDISTGLILFDLSLNTGALFYWYKMNLLNIIQNEKKSDY